MGKSTSRYKQNRLQQLRGFCLAAHTGSMSKAAEKMFLSQPSVTLQIQALERELDTKLFDRKGPKIELTHDGEILYELAQPLVNGFASLDETFNARRNSIDTGRISIAAGGSTIQYVLPKFVDKFVHEYPKVDMRLMSVTGKDGLEMLYAGEVDFCVGPMLDIPEDIEFHPIVAYDSVLITPKGHPLSKRRRVLPRHISKYPLILPPRHLSTWRQVEYVFAQEGLPYEVRLEVGGWEVIKRYVEIGLGVSIVMSICITGNENLEVIPVQDYFPRRTYGVVMRKGRQLSPQARGFIETLDPKLRDLWADSSQ
ncbi:MAG: LysR family transcriptional regulator [Candidatus Hydrogenedentota bacterium]|nr:MAG: LysR family transcriptional regulator [Candidatus Hydrogenedentota bacterium]